MDYEPTIGDMQAKQQAATGAAQCGTTNGRFSPLKARLRIDLNNIGEVQRKSFRALDILDQHPEFELLIELLDLLPVNSRIYLKPRDEMQKPLVAS